jgi:predicted transcriptional regulator of viral defense system
MEMPTHSQQDRALALLATHGMLRISEFIEAGVTAATISRMEQKGLLVQLSRGLYQLHDAPLDAYHSLAVAAKLVPKGVICLDSALAFHELTDRIPHHISVGIGPREWRPRITHPPIQIVRFGPKVLNSGIEEHVIEHVPVKIYGPAKTIVDLFRHGLRQQTFHGSRAGLTHAVQGMKEALRLRKTTPAEIARFAVEAADDERVWKKLQPYLEALTIDA